VSVVGTTLYGKGQEGEAAGSTNQRAEVGKSEKETDET
jgi:hypothetical protein